MTPKTPKQWLRHARRLRGNWETLSPTNSYSASMAAAMRTVERLLKEDGLNAVGLQVVTDFIQYSQDRWDARGEVL